MGYWEQDESGMSFTGSGHTLWGDPPADVMGDAVDKIRDMFTEHIGRPPTVGEIKSGLLFTLSFLGELGDATLYTEENMGRAMGNKLDGTTEPIEQLQPDWEDHAKGTYS